MPVYPGPGPRALVQRRRHRLTGLDGAHGRPLLRGFLALPGRVFEHENAVVLQLFRVTRCRERVLRLVVDALYLSLERPCEYGRPSETACFSSSSESIVLSGIGRNPAQPGGHLHVDFVLHRSGVTVRTRARARSTS